MRISRAPAALRREQPAMQPAHWPFPAPTTQQLYPAVELQRSGLAPHSRVPAWPAAPQTPTRSYSPAYHSCSPVGSPAGSPGTMAVHSPPVQHHAYPAMSQQHSRLQLVPDPQSTGTKPATDQQQWRQPRLHFNVPTQLRQAPQQPQHSVGGAGAQSAQAAYLPMAWLRFAANYLEHRRQLLQQTHRDLAVARLKRIFHRTGQLLHQRTGHPWVRQWRDKYATLHHVHKVQHTQWINRPGAPIWPPR